VSHSSVLGASRPEAIRSENAEEAMRPIAPAPDCVDLLSGLPQTPPFRFVDRILEVDRASIRATYRFREDEPFYAGHFPGRPITPGVILLECMAQCGVALHGLYLLALEGNGGLVNIDHWRTHRTLLTDASIEWRASVYPGETVEVTGTLETWRRLRIRSRVEMRKAGGELVAVGKIAGMGVRI
jgi:3-hydroxyacyl-[acyl-carrier-protein] dehydratase